VLGSQRAHYGKNGGANLGQLRMNDQEICLK